MQQQDGNEDGDEKGSVQYPSAAIVSNAMPINVSTCVLLRHFQRWKLCLLFSQHNMWGESPESLQDLLIRAINVRLLQPISCKDH